MGWVAGPIVLMVSYPLNLYFGLMMERLRRYTAPGAVSMGDLGNAVLGKAGRYVGRWGLYLYLLFTLGDFLVVMATSLQGMVNSGSFSLSKTAALLLTAAFICIPNQLRTLNNTVPLCILSAVTMATALVLSLSHVQMNGCPTDPGIRVAAPDGRRDIWVVMRALSSLNFAFAGNTIYLEMMAEMRKPSEFQKSLHLALPSLLSVYIVVGVMCYAKCGDNTPAYMLDVLPDKSMMKRVVSIMLFLHTLTSYVINQQVFSRGLHLMLDPRRAAALSRSDEGFWVAKAQWLGITTLVLVLALTPAMTISFFDQLVQFIGAALATPLCFIFPIVCFLRAGKTVVPRGAVEGAMAWVLLAFSCTLLVLGTWAVVKGIAED